MKSLLARLCSVLLVISVLSCAKRGRPTGGPVDEEAPVILRAYPDNYSTRFNNQVIEIEFDEFIKLKDLQKQLVVSPPLEYQPVITPQGGVSKKLTIEIKDTLQDNTTYVLDFGQSIVDNNEGNPFPFFRYVFSTGDVIDSLTVKGKITDALKFKPEKFVNVLLYEVNGEFIDTVVTKGKPNYVLNTLDSLSTFTMQNIKAGTYKMVALKEDNRNLKFDPNSDKIGFVSDLITVPSDQTYELKLFKQAQEPSITKPIFKNPQRWDLGYTGSLDSLNLKSLPKYPISDLRITKLTKKDTLEIWQKPAVIKDSVLFNAYYKQFTDTVKVFYKEEKKDSLVVSKSGKFGIGKNILITATTPIEDYNTNLFKLIDKDSAVVQTNFKLDRFKNQLELAIDSQENQKYKLQMFPEAITDYFGAKNIDTLNFTYNTNKSSSLGNIWVTLTGGKEFPILVEIVDEKLEVVEQQTARENTTLEFNYLNPGNYYIRLIYDSNDNGRYDSGDLFKNKQPEKVEYFPELQKLQANWDLRQTVIIN